MDLGFPRPMFRVVVIASDKVTVINLGFPRPRLWVLVVVSSNVTLIALVLTFERMSEMPSFNVRLNVLALPLEVFAIKVFALMIIDEMA